MEWDPNQITSTTINPLSPPPNYGTPQFNIPQNLALRAPIPRPVVEDSVPIKYDHPFMSTLPPVPFSPPPAYGFPPRSVLPPLSPRLQFPADMDAFLYHPSPFPDPGEITPDNIEEYVELGVLKLNKTLEDEEAVQKIVYQLITQGLLTLKVMTALRSNANFFLPDFA
jgi:hypothetical protein